MSNGRLDPGPPLVAQVLARQVLELQECLLKTSILDRFCAPLCEAICNDSLATRPPKEAVNGRKFMETVTEAKLFGIQLEPGGKWIRYHHLFQELLRGHLQRKRAPQDIATLHLSISPATVKTHLNRIYGWLGATSGREAAREATTRLVWLPKPNSYILYTSFRGMCASHRCAKLSA